MRRESEMEEKKGERGEGGKRQAELREKEKGEKCGCTRRESENRKEEWRERGKGGKR
jgi:hypothetical protein